MNERFTSLIQEYIDPSCEKQFITFPQPEKYRQITFEEMLSGVTDLNRFRLFDENGTMTVFKKEPQKLQNITSIEPMISRLRMFVTNHEALFAVEDRHTLYRTYHIPKRTRGYRTINDPNEELSQALRELKGILEGMMIRAYHTSAYAYVKRRCTVDAVKKHQSWGSNWFGHFDFHDFFGSTTLDFVMDMFSRIYPFGDVIKNPEGKQLLQKSLSLGFLDGGLPQGTPLSPFITNVMMIPFDHIVSNVLHCFPSRLSPNGTERLIYTRYADDLHISCRVGYDIKEVEQFLLETLNCLHAPFSLNTEKTHYNSKAGKNFMLGVILNRDNAITVGHVKKRYLKASLHNYLMDRKNGIPWELEDLQRLQGQVAYRKSVEPQGIGQILEDMGQKFGTNVQDAIEESLKMSA